ncbi:MAG: TylF/MycF/NovP-related O-methyltransferase [Ferruginibacter sp.]
MGIKTIIKGILPIRLKRAIGVFLHPNLLPSSNKKSNSNYPEFPYFHDGLATMHKHDFMTDERFINAFSEAEKFLLAPKMYWRTYIICWAASKGVCLEGDFVECGVFKGGFAKAVISYTQFEKLNKTYFLFDTFNGLSKDHSSDKEKTREFAYYRYQEDYFEEASNNFINYDNVKLVKGIVPESLQKVEISKVAFLSLDMNSAIPEEHALNYFWDKLSSGAVIVFDDYGFNGYEEQKIVHDEFALSKNLQVLLLPTGQGLLFKP